jgi:hypothetical protein
MDQTKTVPSANPAGRLDEVTVRLIEPTEYRRFQDLLAKHHYLGRIKPVGERLCYVAVHATGRWVALLVFNAAAKHLKHRDRWIKWTARQRDRRLPLVTNNSRFLILPEATVPNLGSKVLSLGLGRLRADWQTRYGHPVEIVETFVDPAQFDGTVYRAQGWEELGATDGWGRCRRDYYTRHDKPKRLFVKELSPHARRSLQAEHLRPELAVVERRHIPACACKVGEIHSLAERFRQVPEYRSRVESYPLWSLLTLVLLAVLSGAPRGQKDLAKFAKRLTQAQRGALGVRRNAQGIFPPPSQSTWSRFFQRVDGAQVDAALKEIQAQIRGPVPPGGVIVFDGKQPKHGPGDSVLTVIHAPSQYYLGSALVDQKTNEIPVARQLLEPLDIPGCLVTGDALHTQDETARMIVLEKGADYLFTVKDNQPTLNQTIAKLVPAPEAGFFPSKAHERANGSDGGLE